MSTKEVLRDFHFQINYPEIKTLMVVEGSVFDIAANLKQIVKFGGNSMKLNSENLLEIIESQQV